MRIYFKLFESEVPLGVRELARDLNLPVSTVHYNLRRLESLGIISKSSGGYVVSKSIPIEGFLTIRRKLIPRLLLYSVFFLGVTLGVIITLLTSEFSADKVLTVVVSATASIAFLLEGMNIRKKLA